MTDSQATEAAAPAVDPTGGLMVALVRIGGAPSKAGSKSLDDAGVSDDGVSADRVSDAGEGEDPVGEIIPVAAHL